MKIAIPRPALVLVMGPAGAGKSTFAAAQFRPTEVISSDFCRALVADDENDLAATPAAFEVLHLVVRLRLRRRRLAVVDAVSATAADRSTLLSLAHEYDSPAIAIVLLLPEEVCRERDRLRPGRTVGEAVISAQRRQLLAALPGLVEEGFDAVHVLESAEAVEEAAVRRVALPVNARRRRGPFDVIGDVHGCLEELVELLRTLGYGVEVAEDGLPQVAVHPGGRKAVFTGDLVGPGPDTPGVLRLVMGMVRARQAMCVRGDHDDELLRALRGNRATPAPGREPPLAQLSGQPALRDRAAEFLDGLPSHYVLDGGALVVAHAGITSAMQGRDSPRVRRFTLRGETAGQVDERGLAVRPDWARDYRGRGLIVHGHAPVPEPRWVGRTVDIDTGCVFGGVLTALRYPELELVSVPAARAYARRLRPGEDRPATG